MNKTRMLELADHLDSLPRKRFEMSSFWDVFRPKRKATDFSEWTLTLPDASYLARALRQHCNTSACYAGWTVALHPRAGGEAARGRTISGRRIYDVADHAQAILGLNDTDAQRLFYQGMGMTPKQAARRLRKAVKQGYVEDLRD